jgi:hypothetical protein
MWLANLLATIFTKNTEWIARGYHSQLQYDEGLYVLSH